MPMTLIDALNIVLDVVENDLAEKPKGLDREENERIDKEQEAFQMLKEFYARLEVEGEEKAFDEIDKEQGWSFNR